MADRAPLLGVLVVDDSDEFLDVAASCIRSVPGLSLLGTATDGDEAVSATARLAPDLVLIDAFMPGTDGFAATRAIKARTAPPWVVLVSVHEGSAMEHEAWAAGADAFLVKTNLVTELPGIVRRLHAAVLEPARKPAPRAPESHFADPPVERRGMASLRALFGIDAGASASRVTEPASQVADARRQAGAHTGKKEDRSMKGINMKRLGIAGLALALAATPALAAGGKTTFTSLGVPFAQPWDMNGDGTKLVGAIGFGDYFYWTAAEGVVSIGGGGQAGRIVISGDGSTIAGSIFDGNGIGVAGRWLGGTDWAPLEGIAAAVPCGTDLASAWGIDATGHTLVGLGWLPQECRAHGAAWDLQAGGPAADLGSMVPGSATRANGVSGDGHVIVGWQDDEVGERLGARWVDGVEEYITTPAGENVGEVEATNADGTVMIGQSYPFGNGTRVAWVWTARKGFTGIDSGPVYSYNSATAMSADGSVVGGVARDPSSGRPRAWIYKNNSFLWLTDYLNDKKKLARGWIITAVTAISDDGLTIAGEGTDPTGTPQAWIINNF